MRQFSLKLDMTQQRPVVLLENALTALLDTGAYIPIWTDEEDILLSDMGEKLVKTKVPFTGFGGIAYGNLYQVSLKVGDLIFPNMHIIANNELDSSYNLILSATMFNGLSYEINTRTHCTVSAFHILPDCHIQAVYKQEGVKLLQGAVLPFIRLFHNPVRDAGDCLMGNLKPIDIFYRICDITLAHALCVHG